MKIAIFTFATLLLAGCGHNAVTYGDGVSAEIGFIPDQYKVALTFRYGKIFSAVVKEKTKLTLTTDADNNGIAEKAGQNTNVKTTLTLETGDQITGYGVEKAKVEAAAGGSTANAAKQ